ncbi:MAG: hypothetical protein ACXIVQ_14055 [Acidimicrobiales bacterium]
MNDPIDDKVRNALRAEGDRVQPDPGAWRRISARVGSGTPGRSAPILAAAAVVVLVAAVVGVMVLGGEDEDATDVATDTTTSTIVDETTTTTAVDDTTTTTEPAPTDGPLDMGPQPDRRDVPPEELVVVLDDGRLAVVETATGSVVRVLDQRGDLREIDELGMSYGIWDVAVTPDGSRAFFTTCCEPAAGALFSIPTDGSDGGAPVVNADHPQFTTSDNWVVASSMFLQVHDVRDGTTLMWQPSDDVLGLGPSALSPDGRRVVTSPWSFGDAPRPPLLVATIGGIDDSSAATGSDMVRTLEMDESRDLGDGSWTLPTFRRDGRLVVAEEQADGSWVGRVVDIDTGEVDDSISYDYGGVPVTQRHDGSGEWLLAVVTDDPETFPQVGRLVWFGPDGQSGTVPGSYLGAGW